MLTPIEHHWTSATDMACQFESVSCFKTRARINTEASQWTLNATLASRLLASINIEMKFMVKIHPMKFYGLTEIHIDRFNSDLTHWPLGDYIGLLGYFQVKLSDWLSRCLSWNRLQINVTRHHWWLVNIGPGNGLVPLVNQSLPKPNLN